MKKNNGFPLIFWIPLVVASFAVAGVFAYKLYSEGIRTKAAEPVLPKNLPALPNTRGKPASGYGSLVLPTQTPTPTPQEQGVSADTILTATDEGSVGDFQSIDAATAGL